MLIIAGRIEILKEIVKDQHKRSGLSAIYRKNVKSIVVLGSFGNSVSSTPRSILDEAAQKMNWKCHQCRYTDIPDTIEEKTIVFVYGWFGCWNNDLCSVDAVNVACQKLIGILSQTRYVKVIIGMRSDLYKDHHRDLKEHKILFKCEINLDGENHMIDREYLSYFEKIKKSCELETCSCKRLTFEKLRDGNDIDVGMPLKMNMIRNHHDLVSQYDEYLDILKVMKNYIIAMETDMNMKLVYSWIKYLCLKGKFSRSDEFEEGLVEDLRKSSFDENDSNFQKYFRKRNSDERNNISAEDAQYVFWHPFIYICVFHSLFEQDPGFVMKHCNLDAIFQLVRPEGRKRLYEYIEVFADEKCVNLFNERLQQQGFPERYKSHPFIKMPASLGH